MLKKELLANNIELTLKVIKLEEELLENKDTISSLKSENKVLFYYNKDFLVRNYVHFDKILKVLENNKIFMFFQKNNNSN